MIVLTGPRERDDVTRADLRARLLEIPPAPDLDGTYRAFARTLTFPRHFGQNLDALLDCLRELDPGTRLLWNGDRLRAADPESYRRVLSVLAQFEDGDPRARVYVRR